MYGPLICLLTYAVFAPIVDVSKPIQTEGNVDILTESGIEILTE